MEVFSEKITAKFWNALSLRAKLQILLGIFSTVTAVGLLLDISKLPEIPPLWIALLRVAVLGGGAVSAFILGIKNRLLSWATFPVVIPLLLLINQIPFQPIPEEMIKTRLYIDTTVAFLAIITSYALFIRFISREGSEKLELQTEMVLAQEIHRVLVPPISGKDEHVEIEGISLPMSEVGGDLIDVVHGQNGHTCIIADVSGHGVSAGLVMGTFKSAVRILLQKPRPPAEWMTRVNALLFDMKTKNMFVTAAAFRVGTDNAVEFTVAGHLPILHLRHETGTVEKLWIKQPALGIRPAFKYASENVSCQKGDIIVLLTDGLPEVHNKKEEQLGMEKIEETLKNNGERPLRDIRDAILTLVDRHGSAHDDQTILLMRRL
ncbi:MAG: serine/threonine-protein phosphatase [bacterium]|nr:serine/threonine-protein phosphatase [bacterium]